MENKDVCVTFPLPNHPGALVVVSVCNLLRQRSHSDTAPSSRMGDARGDDHERHGPLLGSQLDTVVAGRKNSVL